MTGPEASGATAAAGLVVESATGVDVRLAVAGPGARAFAFVVDWVIRAVVLLAWYVVAALIYNGRLSLVAPLEADAAWFIGVVIPAAAIFFLYHVVLEIAMRGRTPGKRIAGVRIVSREGSTPSVGALLTRNVFRLIDSFPALYGVGLIVAMLTRDRVRVGDLAAGTLLVYERSQATVDGIGAAMRGARLDAGTAEVVSELARRWPVLEPRARRRLAEQVLARQAARPDESAAAQMPAGDDALRARIERLARGGEP